MKAEIFFSAALALAHLPLCAGANTTWICSTEGNEWRIMDAGAIKPRDGSETVNVRVDPSVRYQTMDSHPWGGCFNEQGWYAMRELSDGEKDAVVAKLYGTGDDSLGLSAGRTAIGSSDYGVIHYSYDETRGDLALEHFSIERDRLYMLPYIKSALKRRPDMFLFGSPWTPPSWLKNTGLLHGRLGPAPRFVMTKENLDCYARYFVKYIEAYGKEGVRIAAVTPQNEPTMNTAYPSCVWTGEELHEFLKGHLIPAVKNYNAKNRGSVEVWLGTFTDSNPSLCLPSTEDPETLKDLGAVCFQWWGANLAKRVRKAHKGLKTVQSETKCGDGRNDWSYAEEQFDCFKEFLDAGVSQYFLWNMILDSRGLNNSYTKGKWSQNAPITVDGKTVKLRPSYYLAKHFSATIMPGARRLMTTGDKLGEGSVSRHVRDIRAIAFQNPGGEIVVNVKNSTDSRQKVSLAVEGLDAVSAVLEAHSVNTFKFDGLDFAPDAPDATYDPGADTGKGGAAIVKLAEAKSGDLVSVKDASIADGAHICLETNKGEAFQTWKLVPAGDGFYTLLNLNSDAALGVYGASDARGAKVVQWTANGSEDQQWKIVPYAGVGGENCFIANRQTGMCLTPGNDGTLGVQPFVAADGQLFKITVVSGELEHSAGEND